MTFELEKISETSLVKVEGRPNLPEKPRERTRWERFKFWLSPHLKKNEELAEAYAKAKVEKEKSEARKRTEEAAEIAARKDLTRQKEVKEFCNIVDVIFADDGLPPGAKALKLAKLMEENPQVAAQLDKIKDLIEKLALSKGLNIEVVDESHKALQGEADETK